MKFGQASRLGDTALISEGAVCDKPQAGRPIPSPSRNILEVEIIRLHCKRKECNILEYLENISQWWQ